MFKLTLAVMIIVTVYLGVMLVIKVRRMSAWSPPEQTDKDGTPIRVPRELLELEIDHAAEEMIPNPDEPESPPKDEDSRRT